MSVFRATMVLIVTATALLYTGCGAQPDVLENSTPSDLEKEPFRRVLRKTEKLSFSERHKSKLFISPDRRSVACEYSDGEGERKLIIDGSPVAVPSFNRFYSFSPCRKKYALSVYVPSIFYKTRTATPSGKIERYPVTGRAPVVMVNGEILPYWHASYNPVFSEDGERVAYETSDEEGGEAVALDVEFGPFYERIVRGSLTFSPDGKRLAYVAKENDTLVFVVDGREQEQKGFNRISSITFSMNSRSVGYIAHRDGVAPYGEKGKVVVNGRAGREYHAVNDILFSEDGEHFSYLAANWSGDEDNWTKVFVVLDHEVINEYIPRGEVDLNEIKGPSGFIGGLPVYRTIEEDGFRVVYGNSQYGPYKCDWVYHPVLSPDRSLVLFALKDEETIKLYQNGVELEEFSGERVEIVFAPVGSNFVACIRKNRKEGYRVSDCSVKGLTLAHSIAFSPDGKFVSYIAKMGDKWHVVVNNSIKGGFDHIYSDRAGSNLYRFKSIKVIWDSPTEFHYLARDGDKIYLVEEEIVEE